MLLVFFLVHSCFSTRRSSIPRAELADFFQCGECIWNDGVVTWDAEGTLALGEARNGMKDFSPEWMIQQTQQDALKKNCMEVIQAEPRCNGIVEAVKDAYSHLNEQIGQHANKVDKLALTNALSAAFFPKFADLVKTDKPALWSGGVAKSLLLKADGHIPLESTQLGDILGKTFGNDKYPFGKVGAVCWHAFVAPMFDAISAKYVELAEPTKGELVIFSSQYKQSSTFYSQELPNIIRATRITKIAFKLIPNKIATETDLQLSADGIKNLKEGGTIPAEDMAKLRAIIDAKTLTFDASAVQSGTMEETFVKVDTEIKTAICAKETDATQQHFNIVDPCSNVDKGGELSFKYTSNKPSAGTSAAEPNQATIYQKFCAGKFIPQEATLKAQCSGTVGTRVAATLIEDESSTLVKKLLAFSFSFAFSLMMYKKFVEKQNFKDPLLKDIV